MLAPVLQEMRIGEGEGDIAGDGDALAEGRESSRQPSPRGRGCRQRRRVRGCGVADHAQAPHPLIRLLRSHLLPVGEGSGEAVAFPPHRLSPARGRGRAARVIRSRSQPSATSSPAVAIFFARSACSSACTSPRCRDGSDDGRIAPHQPEERHGGARETFADEFGVPVRSDLVDDRAGDRKTLSQPRAALGDRRCAFAPVPARRRPAARAGR